MRITQINIKNSGAIACFNMELNGENLEISGDTGTGKTTAISALFDIIKKRSDILRHGEKKSKISVTLSDGTRTIYAERRTTKSSSPVVLTAIDGDGKKSDISIADFKNMISELSVNPHKIMDLTPKSQTETLLKSAKISIDLDSIDQRIATAEDARLAAHRKSELLNPGEKPEEIEEVNVLDLLATRDELQLTNADNDKKRDLLNSIENDLQNKSNDIPDQEIVISNLNIEFDAVKEKIIAANKGLLKLQDEQTELKDRIKNGRVIVEAIKDEDVSEITLKIDNAQETNKKATAYTVWIKKNKEHIESVSDHKSICDNVKELQETRKSALDSAEWPIPGLSVSDGQVIYNDCLLSNLGESEQMLVCAALAIEDIKASPIKVVRIDGVESMSKRDFIELQTLFSDEGIQVLSTRVSRGDVEPQEIVITNGKYGDSE